MRRMKRAANTSRIFLSDAVCPAAALLPGLGFFGFLLMGKRSGRGRYTSFGRIYGGAAAVLTLLYVLYRTADLSVCEMRIPYYLPLDIAQFLLQFGPTGRMAYNAGIHSPVLRTLVGYADLLFPLLRTMLYLGCLIHTIVCTPGYRRYLREAVYPYRSMRPSLRLTKKRRAVFSLWMLWCLVPGCGFIAPLYAARITKNHRMQRISGVLLGVSAASLLLTLPEPFSGLSFHMLWGHLVETIDSQVVSAILLVLSSLMKCFLLCAPVVSYLLSRMMHADVLDVSAEAWFADTAAHPSYASRKWRLRNGIWQILCELPCIGGLGLIVGGTGAKDRRARKVGYLHLGVSMAFMLLMLILFYARNRYGGSQAHNLAHIFFGNRYNAGIRDYLQRTGLYLIWCFGIAFGCMFRREILLKRSDVLGDCLSGIEREIRLTKRFRELGAAPVLAGAPSPADPDRTEPEPPDPQPAGAARTAPRQVDLNTCEKSELTTVPGMTADAAERFWNYRRTYGAVRSRDELLDVLDVKPHESVRILENSALSAPPPNEPETRRRIDL